MKTPLILRIFNDGFIYYDTVRYMIYVSYQFYQEEQIVNIT